MRRGAAACAVVLASVAAACASVLAPDDVGYGAAAGDASVDGTIVEDAGSDGGTPPIDAAIADARGDRWLFDDFERDASTFPTWSQAIETDGGTLRIVAGGAGSSYALESTSAAGLPNNIYAQLVKTASGAIHGVHCTFTMNAVAKLATNYMAVMNLRLTGGSDVKRFEVQLRLRTATDFRPENVLVEYDNPDGSSGAPSFDLVPLYQGNWYAITIDVATDAGLSMSVLGVPVAIPVTTDLSRSTFTSLEFDLGTTPFGADTEARVRFDDVVCDLK